MLLDYAENNEFLKTQIDEKKRLSILHYFKNIGLNKSFNKYACTKQWICRNTKKNIIISFLRIEWLITYENFTRLHTNIYYAKSGWNNLSCGSGEDDFEFHQCLFLLFHYSLSLEKDCLFIWTWTLFIQECFMTSIDENSQVVMENIFFIISLMYFPFFHYYIPLERAEPPIWTNMSLIYPRMLCLVLNDSEVLE